MTASRTFKFVMPHGQVTSQDIRDELTAFARWQEEQCDEENVYTAEPPEVASYLRRVLVLLAWLLQALRTAKWTLYFTFPLPQRPFMLPQ